LGGTVNKDSSGTPISFTPDGAKDTVSISGTTGADLITLSSTHDDRYEWDGINVAFGSSLAIAVNQTRRTSDLDVVTVNSGAGNDTIVAGPGDGTTPGVTSDVAALSLDGGDNNDNVQGSKFADSIFGGSGNDSIDAGDGVDTIDSGLGDDSVTGGL